MKVSEIFDVKIQSEITSLSSDSRNVTAQAMFFCMEGLSYDGHDFIDDAIAKGAVCIVHAKERDKRKKGINYIKVKDVKLALNHAIKVFYENCFDKMKIIGITGTEGKTTSAYWLKTLMQNFENCGYIGDIGIHYADCQLSIDVTNLEEIAVADYLHKMYQAGCYNCVIELSSINLDLHPPDFINYEMAVLTNFSSRHLDFHGTLTNYLAAKKQLFDNLQSGKTTIINKDDAVSATIIADCPAQVLTYGIDEASDYRATNITCHRKGSDFNLVWQGTKHKLVTKALGKFSIYNILAVTAALCELGFPVEDVIKELEKLPVVPGRMETIDGGQDFTVVVDYAYSPESFERVFQFARDTKKNQSRIIAVFGAPGKRESQKRHLLGAVADKYADLIILTEEDQRNENPQEIAEQIATGIKNCEYYFIEEREIAIQQAIALAQKDDIVLILAKGDELFNDRGLGKMMYNYAGDATVATMCLKALLR